jgi:aminoglycoside phosphotransferase (APT) family kinase protein
METPKADIPIDEPLVRQLLREQHPDLETLELRLVANGWDNVIYRLGDELVVRLPRRLVAVPLVEHEQRWLPEIAGRVTVAVPAPLRVGLPSDTFPWHWTIAAWLDGELASETAFEQHGGLAIELAEFLRQLHIDAPRNAPHNPFRGVPLAEREVAIRDRLATGLLPRPRDVEDVWQRALAAPPWTAPPQWLHGDLHPANILIREGRLAAVLDFGDLCSGDPATDLATAWLSLDADGREQFRGALDYDDATWVRARGWALLMGAAFLVNSGDNAPMRRIGTHALEQVLLSQP